MLQSSEFYCVRNLFQHSSFFLLFGFEKVINLLSGIERQLRKPAIPLAMFASLFAAAAHARNVVATKDYWGLDNSMPRRLHDGQDSVGRCLFGQ